MRGCQRSRSAWAHPPASRWHHHKTPGWRGQRCTVTKDGRHGEPREEPIPREQPSSQLLAGAARPGVPRTGCTCTGWERSRAPEENSWQRQWGSVPSSQGHGREAAHGDTESGVGERRRHSREQPGKSVGSPELPSPLRPTLPGCPCPQRQPAPCPGDSSGPGGGGPAASRSGPGRHSGAGRAAAASGRARGPSAWDRRARPEVRAKVSPVTAL